MKDFKNWGLKVRTYPEYNYKALWHNLKTIRVGEGKVKELPIDEKEFYDVAINTTCNAGCNFCYVSAGKNGINYPNICETWKRWMNNHLDSTDEFATYTNKPFQIAIGSTGEPTLHPEFCEFLETVSNTGVVPNYTTNGIILASWCNPLSENHELANKILEYTSKYVGGVAVSFGNKNIRAWAREAINGLIAKGNTNINIHHLISTKKSVDEFVAEYLRYGDSIAYHVLLPLMPAGRSTKGIENGVWEYLEEVIEKNQMHRIAFGAHFIKNLQASKIKTWLYDEHSLSANCLLKPDGIVLTKSSFDLTPIKVI